MALAPGEEPSEATLVESFRSSRDNCHFEALYRSVRRNVFGLCLKFLRNVEAAQDATHETFVRAYEQFSTFRGTNFSAWVMRIAANHCLNGIRQEATWERLVGQSGAIVEPEFDGERAVILSQEVDIARDILRSLNPGQRKVLLLRYLDGYSHEEIQEITGYDGAQVRSHLQNGRRNFRIRWLQRVPR